MYFYSNPEKSAAPVKNSLFVETVVPDESLPMPIIDDLSSQQSRKQRIEDSPGSTASVGANAATKDATPMETLPSAKEEPGTQGIVVDGSEKRVDEVPTAVVGQPIFADSASGEFVKLQAPSVDLKGEVENGTPVHYSGTGTTLYPLDGSGTHTTEDMPSFNEWAKKRLEEQGMHGEFEIIKGVRNQSDSVIRIINT